MKMDKTHIQNLSKAKTYIETACLYEKKYKDIGSLLCFYIFIDQYTYLLVVCLPVSHRCNGVFLFYF